MPDAAASPDRGPPAVGEIESLRAAGYPFLFVPSDEEERLGRLLAAQAAAPGRVLETPLAPALADGGAAGLLPRLLDGDAPGLILCRGWRDADFEGAVVRRLREAAPALSAARRSLVFSGAGLSVPPELAQQAAVVDLPPPDPDELEPIARAVLAERVDAPTLAALVQGARGLSEHEARRAFQRVANELAADPARDALAVLVGEKRRLVRRGGYLEDAGVPEGTGAVGGLAELKRWVAQRERAFSPEARAFGLPMPRGVLLIGVQGCGKSLMAKAIAAQWRFPLLRLDLGALFGGEVAPEQGIRRVIATAEAMAPCVLWMDELEKGFTGLASDPVLARLFGQFLVWLQEKRSPVFVAATANRIDALPPELLRKGRFDEIFFVDLPDADERRSILDIHLARVGRDPARFDRDRLVDLCNHFTGAEIEQVVAGGLARAFAAGRELAPDDLEEEARRLVPFYATYEEHIKALRDWAERRARRASTDTRLAGWFAGRNGAR